MKLAYDLLFTEAQAGILFDNIEVRSSAGAPWRLDTRTQEKAVICWSRPNLQFCWMCGLLM